jgi:hypothetical protein
MAGKKALGSWDVNDKRTKAGKSKHLQTNGVKMFDNTVGLATSLFKSNKKSKKVKSNSKVDYSAANYDADNYDYTPLTEEEKRIQAEKDKISLPFLIIGGIISVILVLLLWVFIISLFR